jgi:hypothetical protein
MRSRLLGIVAVVAVAALAVPAAAALAGSGPARGPHVIPPTRTIAGKTYSQWSAIWWRRALSIPKARNPFLQKGRANCGIGRDDVRFLFGTFATTTTSSGDIVGKARRRCTIPRGTRLFLPTLNAECSTAEGNGKTTAKLRACARALIDPVRRRDLRLIVDGVRLRSFRVGSPLFRVRLPRHNVLGVRAQKTKAVANGFWAMLAPLPRGRHRVTFGGSVAISPTATFTTRVTYRLRVSRED